MPETYADGSVSKRWAEGDAQPTTPAPVGIRRYLGIRPNPGGICEEAKRIWRTAGQEHKQ